jgi:hypothetical protein
LSATNNTTPYGVIGPRYIRLSQALQLYPWRRAKLYELIREGRIKSFLLMEPGASRGLRLVDRYSMDEFLERAAEEAEGEAP